MSPLEAWRDRYGVARDMAAIAAGCSPELIERIEAGEVEPELELAVRIHVMTGGDVPVGSWASLDHYRGCILTAAGANGPRGWGVALLLGAAPIAWLDQDQALELAQAILQARRLVRHPPAPMPVQPMELVD